MIILTIQIAIKIFCIILHLLGEDYIHFINLFVILENNQTNLIYGLCILLNKI